MIIRAVLSELPSCWDVGSLGPSLPVLMDEWWVPSLWPPDLVLGITDLAGMYGLVVGCVAT